MNHPVSPQNHPSYRRSTDEVLAELGVAPRQGISGAEARARLERCGRNELAAEPPTPAKLPHEEVYVRLGPSKVDGIGVFAIRPIAAGAPIFPNETRPIRWVGVEEVERSAPSAAARRFYEDFGIKRGDRIGCPQDFSELTPSWYLNAPPAGKAANVRAEEDFSFRAARDIEDGEELLIDYRSFSDGAG